MNKKKNQVSNTVSTHVYGVHRNIDLRIDSTTRLCMRVCVSLRAFARVCVCVSACVRVRVSVCLSARVCVRILAIIQTTEKGALCIHYIYTCIQLI